ncbi:MAG: DctP family TRAP transporter solute-binding subunit [Candidatus Accumulibacter sp.]|jgi:C4-dicarboxylate-binding protein DctP|nr:DctP family TRAP transporter solute-binding subunit [Accumulibacter sp.]
MRNTVIVLLIAALCAIMPLHAAQPRIVIKFSHVVASDAPKGKAARFFAERAAQLTRGAVKVEVYADSSLYRDKDEMEALQLGMVQMLAPSLTKLSPLGVKEFELFDLPYIFDGTAQLHKITQGPIGTSLLTRLEPKGIKGLAFWDNGLKSFSANKPLRTPADFQDLKLRIQPSKVLESQVRALGAIPLVTAFSDAYQALQTGVVDGTENPHSNFYTQEMHEVQEHVTLTEHGYLGYVVIVNKRFWDGLPANIRYRLELAMREATAYANRIAQEENDKALARIRASGKTTVYTPTPAERAEFKQALIKTHQEMAPRIGKEIIDTIYRETSFDWK